MGLFRAKEPEPATPEESIAPEPAAPRRKGTPTPSRKQAEQARRDRRTPVLTKKELRRRNRQAAGRERAKLMEARETTPERTLLRDYIDSRFNVGEFLLPMLALMLALTFLSQVWSLAPLMSTAGLYAFIFLTAFDIYLMWRGFKKVLAERHPRASRKGLLGYAINRSIQIRRFRNPAPRIKRGEEY
ncbi:DUF3043 domain-containing protein [Enemella sp. A6]|uniref:DUF3043 domain-containing protein n=1 Tax=Enemella sp. A6 TaxID=3440152 RepID=UPI003EBA5019